MGLVFFQITPTKNYKYKKYLFTHCNFSRCFVNQLVCNHTILRPCQSVYKLHRTAENTTNPKKTKKYLFVMNVVTDAVIFKITQILITRTEAITDRLTADRVSDAKVMVIKMTIMAKTGMKSKFI